MTEAFRPQARAPKGFVDKRADDIAAERRIVDAVSAVYERYGFEPLATGGFEYADALGKFLPDDDRPNEGVFALQDDDEQWMALRYDLTAPLARFVAELGDPAQTVPALCDRQRLAQRKARPRSRQGIHPVRRRHGRIGAARGRRRDHRHGGRGLRRGGTAPGRLRAEDQQPQAAERPFDLGRRGRSGAKARRAAGGGQAGPAGR